MIAKFIRVLTVAVLMAVTSVTSWASNWEIDAVHTSAQFSVRHMMVSNTRGHFNKISGSVNYDGKDLSKAVVDIVIDAASVDTSEPKRDEHLRGADFFDVAKYPTITFKSKRVESISKDGFKLIGDLTMHGVTKEVALDVTNISSELKDPRGVFRMGATASTKINRKDFGIVWNRALDNGGLAIGEEVAISIELELQRKPAETK